MDGCDYRGKTNADLRKHSRTHLKEDAPEAFYFCNDDAAAAAAGTGTGGGRGGGGGGNHGDEEDYYEDLLATERGGRERCKFKAKSKAALKHHRYVIGFNGQKRLFER